MKRRAPTERLLRAIMPRLDALITERLLVFYDALVARGQLPRSYPPEPPRTTGGDAPDLPEIPGADDDIAERVRHPATEGSAP